MKRKRIISGLLALGLSASLLLGIPVSAEEASDVQVQETVTAISTNTIPGWPQGTDITSEAAVVM